MPKMDYNFCLDLFPHFPAFVFGFLRSSDLIATTSFTFKVIRSKSIFKENKTAKKREQSRESIKICSKICSQLKECLQRDYNAFVFILCGVWFMNVYEPVFFL